MMFSSSSAVVQGALYRTIVSRDFRRRQAIFSRRCGPVRFKELVYLGVGESRVAPEIEALQASSVARSPAPASRASHQRRAR